MRRVKGIMYHWMDQLSGSENQVHCSFWILYMYIRRAYGDLVEADVAIVTVRVRRSCIEVLVVACAV